jgi:hypothetical protein
MNQKGIMKKKKGISNAILLTFCLFLCFSAIAPQAVVLQAKQYKGAELRTNATFLYGRFEVRMRSAAGSGLLSSFFTYHESSNLPAEWAEIDIEILGQYIDEAQFNVISPGQIDHVYENTLHYNPHLTFHEYAIEWTPDYVAWFVDGIEVHRQTGNHVQQIGYPQKNMMNIWPPDYPSWVGSFNPAVLPVYAYYDWVKYYAYTPNVNNNFTLQWTDNFNSWNQGRWQKGIHTWNGNSSDFIAENAVFKDGYLILCLTDNTNLGFGGSIIFDHDIVPPYVAWARNYGDYIKIYFSEPLDLASAQTVSNYQLSPLTITDAVLQSDQRTVKLYAPQIDPGASYNLAVSGIKDQAPQPNTMGSQTVEVKKTPSVPLGINAGGPQLADFLPEEVWSYNLEYGSVGGTMVLHPDTLQISGTAQDSIYRSEIRDLTFYEIRLPDGTYDVTLLFAETEFASPAARLFDVYANGQLVLDDLNIYDEAGLQKNTAVEKRIPDLQIDDGLLELYFDGVVGKPVLSGIKVQRALSGIGSERSIAESFHFSIFPNPFNPSTNIEFTLNKSAVLDIDVFNIRGQQVTRLASGNKAAGTYTLNFNASGLPSGVYFFVAHLDGRFQDIKKAVYIK